MSDPYLLYFANKNMFKLNKNMCIILQCPPEKTKRTPDDNINLTERNTGESQSP